MLVDEVELIIKNNGYNQMIAGDLSVIPNMVDLSVEYIVASEGYESNIDQQEKDSIKTIIADLVFDKEFTRLSGLGIPSTNLSKVLSASTVAIVKNEAAQEEIEPAPSPIEPDSDPV